MATPPPGQMSPAALVDWSPLPKPDKIGPSGVLIWQPQPDVQVSATRVHADLWQVIIRRNGRNRLRFVGAREVAGLVAEAGGHVAAAAA